MTASIPIFPLNTVLYPGGLLPLSIFEQRYLDMTKACIRDNAPFGVCRIREGRAVGPPAVPAQIGCSALIVEWDMPHLGVFHLRTRGQVPFRILQHTTQSDGLVRAEIEWLAEATGKVSAESFALCRRVLEQIIGKIGMRYFFPPLAYDNPRWTSYR
ncbi:MAG: LON peptidase substrate-binding domain-containing protein, partial [bacterium]